MKNPVSIVEKLSGGMIHPILDVYAAGVLTTKGLRIPRMRAKKWRDVNKRVRIAARELAESTIYARL